MPGLRHPNRQAMALSRCKAVFLETLGLNLNHNLFELNKNLARCAGDDSPLPRYW